MPSRPAALAAAAVLAALLVPSSAGAAGSVAVREVDGLLEAAAFSGDATIVARRPEGRGLVVERHVAGRPPAVLLRTRTGMFEDEVRIAASPQATAVSLLAYRLDETASSRVLVGPAAGPLREVARCRSALLPAPVSVEGSRIAWVEGGCVATAPRDIEPATIAVGAADPAVAVRRVPAPEERLPAGLALGPSSTVAGLLRPAFTAFFNGELRRVEGEGFGPVLEGGAAVNVQPVGVLPGDVTAVVRVRPSDDRGRGCDTELLALPPAAVGGGPRRLALGDRCLESADDSGGAFYYLGDPPALDQVATTAGDRLVLRTIRRQRILDRPDSVSLISARADGTDRRLVARGTRHRAPGALVGGSGRAGWVQPRCTGGEQIRAADLSAPPSGSRLIRACRADLLTRRARLRGGAIRLRLRCPRGCVGRVVDRSMCEGETSQTFRFGRGVHTVRLELSRHARRVGRAVLRVRVEHGPEGRRTVRLVRRGA